MKNISRALLTFIVIVSCLFIQPHTCLSAQWLHVATGGDGSKLYINPDSIKLNKEENKIKAWIKLLYGDGYYIVAHEIFDYQKKNYSILKYEGYNRLGQKVNAGKGGATLEPIVHDSIYYILLNYLLETKGLQ